MNIVTTIPCEYWTCTKCGKDFVDPEDFPIAKTLKDQKIVETKDHWLGPTSPICSRCAAESGIPSIDEEEDAVL